MRVAEMKNGKWCVVRGAWCAPFGASLNDS